MARSLALLSALALGTLAAQACGEAACEAREGHRPEPDDAALLQTRQAEAVGAGEAPEALPADGRFGEGADDLPEGELAEGADLTEEGLPDEAASEGEEEGLQAEEASVPGEEQAWGRTVSICSRSRPNLCLKASSSASGAAVTVSSTSRDTFDVTGMLTMLRLHRSRFCVAVGGRGMVRGLPVQLSRCLFLGVRQLFFTPMFGRAGKIRWLLAPTLCLGVRGALANGAVLETQRCQAMNRNQDWVLRRVRP